MNIFILDYNHSKNCEYHVDKHVVKMITEYSQILSTVIRLNNYTNIIKGRIYNHKTKRLSKKERNIYLLNSDYIKTKFGISILYSKQVYLPTHVTHPCTRWANESLSNWKWLLELTVHLNKEYQFRYNKNNNHGAYEVAKNLPFPNIDDIGITEFAQAMPDEYKHDNAVDAYRNYYKGAKKHLMTWTKRKQPKWC